MTTNDPKKPSLSLALKGEIRSLVKADPAMVAFGFLTEDSGPQERRVKLTAAEPEPLNLSLPPESPSRKLKYQLETKVPGREYELVVRLVPPFPQGQLNESIALDTGDTRQKAVQIRSVGTVGPRLALEPDTMQVTPGAAGQPFARTFHFRNRGTAPVKVLGAEADTSEVKVRVVELAPGRDCELHIEAPATFVPPPRGTTVTVRTDDKAKPSLTFRLFSAPTARPVLAPPPAGEPKSPEALKR